MDKAEAVRAQLANDLLDAEREYLARLQSCIDAYRTPLSGKQILSDMVAARIFSNIEQIFEFTNQQCVGIQERVADWNATQSIADIFSFSSESWSDLYSTYAQNYLASMRCLQQQEQINKKFSAFLAEQRSKAGGVSLADALALPLGQLCRYHVLMCQLLRRTDGAHPDYTNLEAAVDSFNIIIGTLDDACTPLVRSRERLMQAAYHLAQVEKEVAMPTMRNALQKAQRSLQRLIAGYLPGAVNAPVRVPVVADQLETLHTAITDVETVLIQLRQKPGALARVKQSGLPPALATRFDEQAAQVVALFEAVFGDALKAAPAMPATSGAAVSTATTSTGAGVVGERSSAQPVRTASVNGGGLSDAQKQAARASIDSQMAGGPRRPSAPVAAAASPTPATNALSPRSASSTRSAVSVRGGSFIAPSGGVGGAAGVIEDAEGQLMWSEAFGKATRSVPCPQFFAALGKYLNVKLNDNERRLMQYVVNMGVEGSTIDIEAFSGFLKGFGPLSSCLQNVKQILGANWFYGFLTHNEAIRLLETEPVGTYLVRFSLSKPGSFALEATILDSNQQPFVLPIQINATPDGGFGIHESDAGDREFASLHELIAYYTAYLLQPLDSTIPFEVWFHGDISSQEATSLLSGKPDGTFLLRFSSRAGCYASSFVENGNVRHALILSVDGGYCVEGDREVYPTVPALVTGFVAGLQRPLVNAENQLKQQIFAMAEAELARAVAMDQTDEVIDWQSNNSSSFKDPADARRSSMASSAGPAPGALARTASQAVQRPRESASQAPPPAGANKATLTSSKPADIAPAARASTPASKELVYMGDNSQNVKGGTLEGLVDHLLDNTASKFAKCFLLTYKSFTTAQELLSLLERNYAEQCGGGDDIDAKKLRLRICNFLKSWAQQYFGKKSKDEDDDEFQLQFQTFAEKHVRPVDGDNLANQLLKTLTKAIEASQAGAADSSAASFVFSSKPPKPELPKKFDSGDWHWSDVSSLEIARQMTLVEEERFRAISPSELIGLAWTKKDKEKRAPNLLKLIARFNDVSNWVKVSLLQEKDIKKRSKLFEKFLEIAISFGELNNYNAAMEITSALESASIFRLKKTKAKAPPKLVAKYDELHAKLSRQQNYKALREAIHSSNPPIIPYFGMYQSDLTFIEEGNPNMLRDTDPPLINFHKRRLIAQVLNDEISQYQQAPYNLQKVPVLRERLEQCLQTPTMNDDDAYKLSLEIEPRE